MTIIVYSIMILQYLFVAMVPEKIPESLQVFFGTPDFLFLFLFSCFFLLILLDLSQSFQLRSCSLRAALLMNPVVCGDVGPHHSDSH